MPPNPYEDESLDPRRTTSPGTAAHSGHEARVRIDRMLIDEVERGLADVEAGRTCDAREALAGIDPTSEGGDRPR